MKTYISMLYATVLAGFIFTSAISNATRHTTAAPSLEQVKQSVVQTLTNMGAQCEATQCVAQ